MNFNDLDDPQPPRGDIGETITAGRRQLRRRRAAASAVVLSAASVAIVATVSNGGDGRSVDVLSSTTSGSSSTSLPHPTPGAHDQFTTHDGLVIRMSLPYSQAVPGGPIKVTFDVRNPTDQVISRNLICLTESPFDATLVAEDGTRLPHPRAKCIGPQVDLGPQTTKQFTTSIDAADAASTDTPLSLGQYSVIAFDTDAGPGADPVPAVAPLELVEPKGRSVVEIRELTEGDRGIPGGKTVDPVLVVYNDTDALIPFPGIGSTCEFVNDQHPLVMQTQLVAPGAAPTPFAWPGVDCTGREMHSYPVLEPGRNEPAGTTLDIPEVTAAVTYSLIADLGFEWPSGISRPAPLTVPVVPRV